MIDLRLSPGGGRSRARFVDVAYSQDHIVSRSSAVAESCELLQGETKARFVERVQMALSGELGVPVSDVTLQAKRAMIAGERARTGQRRGMRR